MSPLSTLILMEYSLRQFNNMSFTKKQWES